MRGLICFALALYYFVESEDVQTTILDNSRKYPLMLDNIYTYRDAHKKNVCNQCNLCRAISDDLTKRSKKEVSAVQSRTHKPFVEPQSNDFVTFALSFSTTPLNYRSSKSNKNLKENNIKFVDYYLLPAKRRHFNQTETTPIYPTVYNAITKPSKYLITFSSYEHSIYNSQTNQSVTENHEENSERSKNFMEKFSHLLENFERIFYQKTFNKLLSISPADRQENGISFIQSGLFLYMTLLTVSTAVDNSTREEIERCLGYNASTQEKFTLLRHIISWFPNSSSSVKFRWASRLVIDAGRPASKQLKEVAKIVHLNVKQLNMSLATEDIVNKLNYMVEKDSGGAMHNTFEENDISESICSVWITTMYIRPRWRSAPTVLNDTRIFNDANGAPQRSVRMIRINDIMRYAALDEWNAEAIEIMYTTPGLTLLLLVPRGRSLKRLSQIMTEHSLKEVTKSMINLRIAATLPIYTLRMTLLLPEKLKMMGIYRLVETGNSSRCEDLRLSHAVQRLMFWAEAGKNAFKDDGIEWDQSPELEFIVDRPYLFYIRWNNITLMNGNFVL